MEYPGCYNDAPAYGLPDAHPPNNEVSIVPHFAECQLAVEPGINPVGSYDHEMTTDSPLYLGPAWPMNQGLIPPFGQPPTYGLTQLQVISQNSCGYGTLFYLTPLLDIAIQPNAYAALTSPPPPAPGWHESNYADEPIQSPYEVSSDREEHENVQSTSLTHLQHEAANLLPLASHRPSSHTNGFECKYPTCSKAFPRVARAKACYNGHLQRKPYRCNGACGDGDCKSRFSSAQNRSRHRRGPDERKAPCPHCMRPFLRQNLARHRGICKETKGPCASDHITTPFPRSIHEEASAIE